MKSARELLKELDEYEEEEKIDWKTTVSKTDYYEKYEKRVCKFYQESVAGHEHNSFDDFHMSTLSYFGYEKVGKTISQKLKELNLSDDKFTLVEVGAGTGIGATHLSRGLCKQKDIQIDRYIYTDPFNKLEPIKEKFPIAIHAAKTDLIGAIKGIQTDDHIKNAILLVCCPLK